MNDQWIFTSNQHHSTGFDTFYLYVQFHFMEKLLVDGYFKWKSMCNSTNIL